MKKTVFTAFCLVLGFMLFAQKPPFFDDIEQMRHRDSLVPPPTGQILFIGSSSFTRWVDVQKAFPDRKITNRAFGGSTLEDQIRYFSAVVGPCRPRQIVIYCGENDFANAENLPVEVVVERFKTLFSMIRGQDRRVRVVYVSMKPSPSRAHLMPKYLAANQQIEAFLHKKQRTGFVDVFSKMLGADGQPRPEIFGDDRLHMNAAGYAIWQRAIEPFLVKNQK